MDWASLTIAIVGGDRREQEIARLAVASGMRVRVCGFPQPDGGIGGVKLAQDAVSALSGAQIALFPLPGMTGDNLYAPAAPAPISINEAVLSGLTGKGLIISGAVGPNLQAIADRLGLTTHAYEHDRASRVLRAPAIAEAAIARIVENTDFSIHGSRIGLLGHGVIGATLARALRSLGAHVTVVARDPVQRAEAVVAGIRAIDFPTLPELLPQLDILISTVPHRLIGAEALRLLPAESVAIDLASPPGGIDHDAAKAVGRRSVWARGLGAFSPVTVGRAQWAAIARIIEQSRTTEGPQH